MGKKKGPGKGSTGNFISGGQITLRQETSGIKQSKGGPKNAKSALKLEHMQKLAVWASGEASIPSLGAYFGRRLAAVGEAMGVAPDPSMFPCQRCETILQPGHNCTIRIEKHASKVQRRRKRLNAYTKNDVVFKCHFCSHRNLKRGTPKDYMKQIFPAKDKQSSEREPKNSQLPKRVNLEIDSRSENETDKMAVAGTGNGNKSDNMAAEITLTAVATDIILEVDGPTTPLPKPGVTLLDSKKKKRNRTGPKKPAKPESNLVPTDAEKSDASNKRRRKTWTSLKEIAENQRSQNVPNLTIPFIL